MSKDLAYAETESGCWLWTGTIAANGYGVAHLADGRSTPAHRAVYEQHVGPIPVGLELDHRCRNKVCVNPAHLEPVTHSENMKRHRAATRVDVCKRGHSLDRTRTRDGGGRYCKTCNRDNKRAQRERLKGTP